MLRTPAVVAACVALLLVAAGCTDDSPQPNYSSVSTSPTASASPTPSGSDTATDIPATGPNVNPGEVPPTQPADATARTQDGALAFVGYYIRAVDWVYATSKPEILSPFFANGCSTCASGQEFISRLVASGDIHGGRVALRELGVVTNDGRGGAEFAVSANISVESAAVVTSDGATSTTFPAAPDTTLTEWIKWTDGHWLIIEERYA